MMAGTPHPRDRPTTLIVSEVEDMPIVGRTKRFHAMDETTICTVETRDRAGTKRGAIAFGMSRHDIPQGFVTYSSIEEAEAIVALLGNAIDDAKRIEAGKVPLAPAGVEPPRKH